MATRPVFIVGKENSRVLWDKRNVEFEYFNGFALSQKQKCIKSLHQSFKQYHPEYKVLEISNKSEDELGIKLSAFNLQISLKDGRKVSVEMAFQAGKVFEKGGPYLDMLDMSSREAKKDIRLKESGKLIGFSFDGEMFETVPLKYFYFWLYMHALKENEELSKELLKYDAFTDIVFNPDKSINCQAEAAAAYVSLVRKGLLEEAMESKEKFKKIVFGYEETVPKITVQQTSAITETGEVTKPYISKFHAGDRIVHPKYGEGEIKEIKMTDKTALLIIQFAEQKKIDELWVLSHCKRL